MYEAHSTHAYQHAARRLRSHRAVTLAVLAIDMLWLLPIASLVAVGRIDGVAGVAVAYLPLVAVVVAFGAGKAPRVSEPSAGRRQ